MTKHYTLKGWFFFSFLYLAVGLSAQPAFTDVTVAKGIKNPINPVLPLEHDGADVTDFSYIGSGAAWLDFNGDGNLDVYITMRDDANRLYQNNGAPFFNFTEVAGTYGIQDAAGDGSGVGVADYDNDGDPDIYICNTFVDRLYRNDGATFTDVTASAGLSTTDDSRTTSASWGDYDQDGYLDLYISRYTPHANATSGSRQDLFYHNDGDGTFTDVSSLLNVDSLMGLAFIASFTDFDNDADLDIIVINDCDFMPEEGRTRIFRNDGGTDPVSNWTFTEVAASVGADDCSNGMGIAIGDINHDGFQEFVNSDIGPINLWKNNSGSFSDIATAAGVDGQVAGHYSWGTNLFDHNNDGWLDLFVVSGSLQFSSGVDPQPNYFYENNGTTGELFTDKSSTLAMNDNNIARNSIAGDFDNDGDLDMLIINYDEEVMLRQNNTSGNNWIKVRLTGKFDTEGAGYSNKDGIGSKIKVTTPDGIVQTLETRSGSSLGGTEQNVAHFGLGANTSINELEVIWPCGNIQTLENINTVNTTLELEETPDAPLPIELISFEATPTKTEVILEWSTAREVDNDHFVIQRSWDGFNYENLGIVFGNGTTESISRYTFTDEVPLTGENYYRLNQVDVDGKSSFSPVRLVLFPNPEPVLEIAPNPVARNTQFEVQFNTPDKKATLELMDVLGQVIFQEELSHDGFIASRSISTYGLPVGIYLLRLAGNTNKQTKKILIR